jgi:hypothetical protein
VPPLNLLADENVDQQIVDRLRREGHTVTYVAEDDPGIDDEVVMQRTNEAMPCFSRQTATSVISYFASVSYR